MCCVSRRPTVARSEGLSQTNAMTSTGNTRADAILRQSQGLAHDALVDDIGAGLVGKHLGFSMDSKGLGTHMFECTDPAYVGWQWAVTVSRAPRAKFATVCEVVLLPGQGSVLSPQWVPWSDRIQPGELEVWAYAMSFLPTATSHLPSR